MNTQKQIVLIVALLFMFVGGCAAYSAIELPIRTGDQTDWTRDQSLERGALLFANNCRTCHGNEGQGGVGPQLLNAELTQFQDQDPLKLKANRDLLRRTLTCGRANTLMPAWLNTNGGSLNAIQIEHLVDFLTSPVEVSDTGEATSHWWEEATHFAANLNGEISVVVSGDTLGSIATRHGIGPKELAIHNGLTEDDLDKRLKKGTEIRIFGFEGDPNGYIYTAYKDNETIRKIAEAQHVGALILADLNGLKYDFTEKRGVATFQLLTEDGRKIAGLFPGAKLKLPAGSVYVVKAGDTLESLAASHSVPESAISGLNRELLGALNSTEDIPFERRLKLPKQIAIVQQGQTLGTIAQLHDIELGALGSENSLADDAAVAPGTQLKLPAGANYVVQAGDTWALVAALHGTTAGEIAALNGLSPEAPITPEVVLQIPQIDQYVVQGESLEDIAGHYGNVDAAGLATKNGIPDATSVIAVGTTLKLPDDSYGTAPGDAKNPGTACVQYAVPSNIFEEISGAKTPIPKPAAASNVVKIDANANDWTLTADGTAQTPNKGVALIKAGSTVDFSSIVGLHNIKLNGTVEGADLKQGDKRTLTFKDPGEYLIECSYHPPMWAYLYVE